MYTFRKTERWQYRTDIKALMCRGIEEKEVERIKMGLNIENGFYGASRAYVPFRFWLLHRKGVFSEAFTLGEARACVKIFLFMHCIDLAGHMMMKQWCKQIYHDHIELNNEIVLNNKKAFDDYIIQKSFFRSRKEIKGGRDGINAK